MPGNPNQDIIGYVTHNITDKHGRLLLHEGTPLTKNMAERLRNRRIFFRTAKNPLGSVYQEEAMPDFPKQLDEKFDCLDIECVKNASQRVSAALSVMQRNTVLRGDIKVLSQAHRKTYAHSINVAIIAAAIAEKMNFSRKALQDLSIGALLHDIGKILLPPAAFNDSAKFSAGTVFLFQQHSVLGADLLAAEKLSPEIFLTVKQHHEHYSGGGYPGGLKGDELHINACITSVANAFDRFTTALRQRDALTPNEAIERILQNRGREFHPLIVDTFIEIFKSQENMEHMKR